MKLITVAVLAVSLCSVAVGAAAKGGAKGGGASHPVKGYTKKDGTYVPPSHATNPDETKQNNWTQKGNVNPYTGKEGTKE